MFNAERIETSLRNRVLAVRRKHSDRTWTAVFLASGSASLEEPHRTVPIEAPAVLWAADNADNLMIIRAGSEGVFISMNEHSLSNAIGHNPEALELRRLVEQNFVINPSKQGPSLRQIEDVFDAVFEETKTKTLGRQSIVEAYIRVLLITLWRGAGESGNLLGRANGSNRILQQFRLLLEQHFRERWSVSNYANAIGVSADHLHEVCQQNLDRAPLSLIHERAIYEAKQLLIAASMTVEQISVHLGYRDSSYFCKQFRKKTGSSPRAYRLESSLKYQTSGVAGTEDFSEWP